MQRDTERYREILKDSERYRKIQKDTEKYRKIQKDTERYRKKQRDTERYRVPFKGWIERRKALLKLVNEQNFLLHVATYFFYSPNSNQLIEVIVSLNNTICVFKALFRTMLFKT